jgi:hypothetical protein
VDDKNWPRSEPLVITDEVAQKAGYPSAELLRMDGELAKLASRYNVSRDREVLKQHQTLYNKMLEMGMTPLMFGADTEILREEYRRK